MSAVTLRLRLSIAALTLAAALGGAFLVSSAPAQTTASTPAKVASPNGNAASSMTQTVLGYGLQNYTLSHKHYCRAMPGSVAARVGIPTSKASEVLAVNGQSRPLSDAQFYTLIRSAPPLRLTLQTPDKQTHQFILLRKEPFSIPAAVSPARIEEVRLLQAELANTTARNAQLCQAQFLAGLAPVQGPGVVVTLRDSKKPFPFPKGMPAGMPPPNIIHDSDINQVVNELKAAGAEAIAVNNQRLVATSAVRSAGPALLINNTPQEPPFVIKAIGDPKTLAGALNIPGGIAAQITNYDKAMFTVQEAATLTLPAYAGGNGPRYAKPVGAADTYSPGKAQIETYFAAVKPNASTRQKQVVVTLGSKGTYFLGSFHVSENQIEPRLAALVRQNPNITAVIKCNTNQFYSRVGQLVDVVKKVGIYRILIEPTTSSSTEQNTLLSAMQTERDQLQVKRTHYGRAFYLYEQAFDDALHQALPASVPISGVHLFAKARNLEFGIGWNATDLAAMKLQAAQHPKKLQDQSFVRQRMQLLADLKIMRAEEMQMFPKDARTQKHLARVHALALHHLDKPMQLQLIDIRLEMLDNQIQHLQASQ